MSKIADRIEELRDDILVHSYLYYEKNTSIISDYEYDMMCKELAELQIKHLRLSRTLAWADYFVGFDGSTGYHLPKNIPYIVNLANKRLEEYEERAL